MADREITWGGLTLGGTTPYVVQSFTGWDERPPVTDMSQPRVRAHGDHMGDMFSQARIVTVSGTIVDQISRDSLVQALESATVISNTTAPLTVELFGRALTVQARVVQQSVVAGDTYGVGAVPFAIQWRCPDPLRYGQAVSASVGLPTTGGGLTYPLAYSLSYGAAGNTGQLTLTNGGTADAPAVFTVSGSLPFGFEVSAGSGRLTFPEPVFTGQPVVIDTGAGTVLVEGTADRRSYLTNADWLQVPAGSSVTVQFTSLGGTYDAAALLTATTSPAFW